MRTKRSTRSTLAAMLLLATATGCVGAAAEAAEAAILRTEDERIAAMLAADVAKLDRYLGNELTYVHSNGDLETKAQFLSRIGSGDLQYKAVRRQDVHVQVFGNSAAVTGLAAMEVRSKGGDLAMQVRFTNVYLARNGRWEMVAWQSTRLP